MERKQILSRLEDAQKIAKVGNWEMRPGQNYFYASKQVYRIFDVKNNQVNYSYADLADPNCPFHVLRAQESSIQEGKQFILILEMRNADNQPQYVEFNSRCFLNKDAEKVYVGTLQDITLQKKAEELQFKQELAEETARVREQVIANVSHELRTPMNAIVGMSNLLVNTPMTEEQEECLSAIQEASQLLLGIINDILLTSSLQNGPIELNPVSFDLSLTVRRVIELLLPKARAKDLELSYQFLSPVEHRLIGDKQRLSQVFYNLIGNAVKFTEEGKIYLTISDKGLKEDGKNYYEFAVHDTGPGIALEKQEEIFQAFNRINTPGKIVEGTGLGLSIVKQLVNQMGGTLSLQSSLGKGSVFSFLLPFELASEQTTAEPLPIPRKGQQYKIFVPKRILVVEDHRMNQIVINKTLLREYPELNIIIANNGEEALKYLAVQAFDLILMDIQLPGIDGFETTRKIRHDLADKHANTPVLAMTAQAQIAEDERYREAGMNDYILKPFNPEELFNKITQHLLK
jgi:signal transduction histidine kinase/ActR/RegA family two-component response regulator